MDARLLIYGCEKERRKLKALCAQKNILCRVVAPADYGQSVGALCGVGQRRETAVVTDVPDMLILAHFAPRQLESFLSALRTARLGIGTPKAVLTETNAAWDAATLAAELMRERAAVEGERA